MKSIEEIKNNIIADNIIKKFYNNKEFWDGISKRKNLSKEFIEKYKDKINFNNLNYLNLDEAFIEKYKDKINFNIINCSNLSENFIIKNKNRFTNISNLICTKYNLSENIIRLFVDKLFFHQANNTNTITINNRYFDGWSELCKYQNLSIKFLKDFQKYIDWRYISMYQKLSDELINTFFSFILWDEISKRKDLTINFLQKYSKYLNWCRIISTSNYNKDFYERKIHKLKKLDQKEFEYLTRYQKLSNNFINKYSKEISAFNLWENIFQYQDYGNFADIK